MKAIIYLSFLTGLFIAAGSFLGGATGAIIALVIAAIINFFSYWYSDKIVLGLYHAKELREEESPNLHRIVEELADEAGIKKPKIFLIPLTIPNAFATGRNEDKAVIGLTIGLIGHLAKDELRGVIAHELSHIKNKDILVSTIAATLAGAITIIGRMAYFASFLVPSRGRENKLGMLLSHLLLIIVTPIVALLIRMAISRSREYLADRGAAKICKSPGGLVDALKKLDAFSAKYPLVGDASNQITSHLFIINPFKKGFLSGLFSTHPSLEERIKRLEAS